MCLASTIEGNNLRRSACAVIYGGYYPRLLRLVGTYFQIHSDTVEGVLCWC